MSVLPFQVGRKLLEPLLTAMDGRGSHVNSKTQDVYRLGMLGRIAGELAVDFRQRRERVNCCCGF